MSYEELEPGSAHWSNARDAAVQYSQAVSLKRIADALEKMVPPDVTSTVDPLKVPGWPEGMTRGDLDDIRSGKARPASTHPVTSTVVTSQEPPVQPVPAGVASPPPDDEEDET